MSTDISGGKKLTGSVFPNAAIDAAGGLPRLEPMLTPKMLQKRFLFGIPLVSPLTKEKLTSADFRDAIVRAVNQLEIDSKVLVQPVIKRHRFPFDPCLYQKNMWIEIPDKPIQKVLRLAICSASYTDTPQQNDIYPSGAEIYRIPNEWIDVSYAPYGKLFVNPINPAFSAIGTSTAAAASGAYILQFIGQQGWVPAYWTVECVHGFGNLEGQVPVFVNECIGALAALFLLDNLIPLFRIASQSLGVDGLSQSVNDLAYQLLTTKRDKLLEQYKENTKKIKALTQSSFFASNI